MKRNFLIFIIGLSVLVYACKVAQKSLPRDANGQVIVNVNPSSAYLSPQESLKTIHLPKGYHLEVVATEPMINEPVAIAWDGNGRMFVAEMNTYMQDVNGTGESKRVCTIKRLEDTNGDGKMDKSVVFLDNLLLPRMILALDDRLLVAETYDNSIYSYRDTNGDGIADEKKKVFNNDKENHNNLEHQRSGLVWNLDNKIYVTVENVRYKFEDNMLKSEYLHESGGGQWGLANDNYGKLYFSSAGGENPAFNFQQNPYFGSLDFGDQLTDDFQSVWPVISTPDVQGGTGRLRPDSTLNHFTACTGQSIFRGNALPADFNGDLLICEPVGRLIRRAKVTNTNGKISLKNAYDKEEFIASTDMNFRPVNTATGPDGCLYIVDMYRGIIQESEWTKPGSYLRPEIVNRGLDKNTSRGRIYRVVHDGIKPDKTLPRMLSQPSAQLIPYLAHANGWWRENAQKILVVRGDKTITPALKAMALSGANQMGRIHALWTLNGLNALEKPTLAQALKDKDPEVRRTAVWIAEEEVRKGDAALVAALEPLKNDPSADVRYQLALTLRFNESAKSEAIKAYLIKGNPQDIAMASSERKYKDQIKERLAKDSENKMLAEADQKLVMEGATIFKQLCATCHGADGKGVLNGGKGLPAPALSGAKDVNGDPEKLIKILLHGLSGPVDGKTYTDVMPALGFNSDEYLASVLSYIRNDFGNKASMVKAADVKKVRTSTIGRTKNWTIAELDALKK
ncbi:MAG: c-type cytochrome [Pedobacter sp.]|nr:MAG: c-type cytochrome [Pedobacter sp.]